MLRTLRASRSLPSLRSTAMAQAAQPAVPVMPLEFTLPRTMATTPLRPRKSKAVITEPVTPLVEPKKRGRPRKNTLTPTTHRRSNSTDAKPSESKRSKKAESVPSIPHPTEKSRSSKGKTTPQSNVPTAADKFQQAKPEPEAKDSQSAISTSNPEDLGTRVQAVSRKSASEAERFAQEAVSAIESAGEGVSSVHDLLQKTMDKANSGKDQYKHEDSGKDIPQGEKNVLLGMLGLTGLWVAFGGKLQKKKKSNA